ncbi:MAG: hypothetical protein QOI94_1213, partial [Acidobacteriaceae bacterium]|nr:hypothetical protein [Acidobacteriaceae bacterium]
LKDRRSLRERPVPIAQQNGDRILIGVRDCQVGVSNSVEFCREGWLPVGVGNWAPE